MKKLLLLVGILVLTLGCSPEPEVIYRDVEVVVTASPTYPLYTSGEARAKIIEYVKNQGSYWVKYDDSYNVNVDYNGWNYYCYHTEFNYGSSLDGISFPTGPGEIYRTGKFSWMILPYDPNNYAWTLQRVASPKVDWHPDYKWTLYERTETISSTHRTC